MESQRACATDSMSRRIGGPRMTPAGLSRQRLMAPSLIYQQLAARDGPQPAPTVSNSVARASHRVRLDGRISERLDGARPGDDPDSA